MKNASIPSGGFSRRDFLLAAAGGAAGLATTDCLHPKFVPGPKPDQPNVLLISVDDLGNRIGALGDPYAHTPNIDALFRQGFAFNNQYVQTASCGPSRTCLMTGMYPDTTRAWHNFIDFRKTAPGTVTMPQLFKENGYLSASIGKTFHLRDMDRDPTFWSVDAYDVSVLAYVNPNTTGRPPLEVGTVAENLYADSMVADAALSRIDQTDGAQPWFISAGFIRPHLPFSAPARFWDLYGDTQFGRIYLSDEPEGSPELNRENGEMSSYDGIPDSPPYSAGLGQSLTQGHYASISFVDEQIGRLLAGLDARGLRDNTLIVFWGDQGFHLGEEGQWAKGMLYDTCLGSPLVFSAPWVQRGGSGVLCETVDILPTVCDLTGLTPPAEVDGVSLLPAIERPDLPFKTVAYSQDFRDFMNPGFFRIWGYSVRTERFRYSEWRGNDVSLQAVELYDYGTFGSQGPNLASDPAYAQVVNDHHDLLNIMWAGAFEKGLESEKWHTPFPPEAVWPT